MALVEAQQQRVQARDSSWQGGISRGDSCLSTVHEGEDTGEDEEGDSDNDDEKLETGGQKCSGSGSGGSSSSSSSSSSNASAGERKCATEALERSLRFAAYESGLLRGVVEELGRALV